MRYLVEKSSVQEQLPNILLYYIKLLPSTTEEKNLLENSGNDERIELYYYEAINQHLGDDFELLGVHDPRGWPHAALVKVQKIVGLGN